MAQLLAPYNNSMRLGQGFNSYIQQICLDHAVLEDTEANQARLERILLAGGASPGSLPAPRSGAAPRGSSLTPSTSSYEQIEPKDATEASESAASVPPEDDEEDYAEAERKRIMGRKGRQTRPIEERPPWVKAQIVTYSSRFVDKLSDVTNAMNISGSLSIKTGTIGGTANGSYVDSDKFKSSDINFHLQVKVTNQLHHPQNYSIFNKIESINDEDFPQVYGDTFISGWEEGGELNAIISMKVSDKSKLTEIKASLEAEMTTPSGIQVGLKGAFELDKKNITKDTETTIAVNWSGGGSIKDPAEEWSIATLKSTAASFPDLVAITPQRTYAILTKYTALESFHLQTKTCRPLDYENAGIYTGALLDHYMDYKVLWKQISQATYELEAGRASIEMAQPSEDMCDLAVIRVQASDTDVKLLTGQAGNNGQSTSDSVHNQTDVTVTKQDLAVTRQTPSGNLAEDKYTYHVFQPSFAGLIKARKVCRFEMSKIVKEVDIIAKHPQLASDPGRDAFFLNPLVFKQMLPILRVRTEHATESERDPYAPLILGYSPPPEHDRPSVSVHQLEATLDEHHTSIKQTLQEVGRKAHDYRIQGIAGEIASVHSRATLLNDLKRLDPTFRPTQLAVWFVVDTVKGIQIHHANGESIRHGTCEGSASHVLDLEPDGSEIIHEVIIKTAVDESGAAVIAQLSVATSLCKVLDTAQEPLPPPPPPPKREKTEGGKPTEKGSAESEAAPKAAEPEPASPPPPEPRKLIGFRTHTFSRPSHDTQWSLRGLVSITFHGTLTTLGLVWGKDAFVPVPSARVLPPLSKDFLALSPAMQKNIRDWSLPRPNGFPGRFLLGHSASTSPAGGAGAGEPQAFNALDKIDFSWRIKSVGFAAAAGAGGKLAGIKVVYFSGKELVHGTYRAETEVWSCAVKSDLLVAKITTGTADGDAVGHISSVEFVRADERGLLPTWPLDISTLRYVGGEPGTAGLLKDRTEVVELAPTAAGVNWSVRGFYGEVTDGLISRLGVVWGRG
ncbi:hypothetical protein B0H63DRAFT_536977 [Podospora didyma]|uniref:Uncharacterized protein n=1 Tax=Podospora didyma TaxID=330526 RepID=A0AAE0NX42_9PEZI|nr:hypothetical protein B0H63DRAFT_536977 [Podospora didyma]